MRKSQSYIGTCEWHSTQHVLIGLAFTHLGKQRQLRKTRELRTSRMALYVLEETSRVWSHLVLPGKTSTRVSCLIRRPSCVVSRCNSQHVSRRRSFGSGHVLIWWNIDDWPINTIWDTFTLNSRGLLVIKTDEMKMILIQSRFLTPLFEEYYTTIRKTDAHSSLLFQTLIDTWVMQFKWLNAPYTLINQYGGGRYARQEIF